MKNKKYYSLIKNKSKKEATLTIFGDITSYPWDEKDVSSFNLSKQLSQLTDVKTINVHINSYGGEVAEGLAIYNSLKNHSATVKTYCDGFACSIASVIFMAGDERIMSNASLLMIHNAWSYATGNAAELRKQADDLDKITQASVNAYMNHVSISEEELKKLLDEETWLDYKEALDKGFATSVVEDTESDKASQSVRRSLIKMILSNQETGDEEDVTITDDGNEEGGDTKMKYECSECGYIHEGELPEFFVCPECGASKDSFVELEEDTTDEEDVNAATDDENKDEDTTTMDEDTGKDTSTDENTNKDDEDEEEVTKEKMVKFFNAIIGGMTND